MRLSVIIYFLCIVLISCTSNSEKKNETILPLQAPYQYFDQLSEKEFHFTELDQKLNAARGENNIEEVNNYTKKFVEAQTNCIQKMQAQFPEGSVKIPFEQIHGKDTLTVTSAYLSGFSFPWETATSICFYFTIEYNIHNKGVVFIPISIKFMDSEEDIIYLCHISANSSGKSRFLVRAQFSFRDFTKLLINQ